MTNWAKNMNREVKKHDSCLLVKETRPGRYDLYRKSSTNSELPHFIFALTDNWQPSGVPVSYGVDVVLNRIKAHDLWRDDTFIERYIREHERAKESKERDFHNSVESFLYDFRRQFQRATNDINTSTLGKIYPEERKRIWQS